MSWTIIIAEICQTDEVENAKSELWLQNRFAPNFGHMCLTAYIVQCEVGRFLYILKTNLRTGHDAAAKTKKA
jgi:hypothetical protein